MFFGPFTSHRSSPLKSAPPTRRRVLGQFTQQSPPKVTRCICQSLRVQCRSTLTTYLTKTAMTHRACGVWDGLLADCPHSGGVGWGGGAGCVSSQDDRHRCANSTLPRTIRPCNSAWEPLQFPLPLFLSLRSSLEWEGGRCRTPNGASAYARRCGIPKCRYY